MASKMSILCLMKMIAISFFSFNSRFITNCLVFLSMAEAPSSMISNWD